MTLKQSLKKIILADRSSIRAVVAQDALDAEDPAGYLKDVLAHGCQSGIVSNLIYYTDTKDFFLTHMDEIDDIRKELEDNLGEPLKIEQPMYNYLAWLGYEETARSIASELDID